MTRALTALVAATLITTITAAAFWAALTTEVGQLEENPT